MNTDAMIDDIFCRINTRFCKMGLDEMLPEEHFSDFDAAVLAYIAKAVSIAIESSFTDIAVCMINTLTDCKDALNAFKDICKGVRENPSSIEFAVSNIFKGLKMFGLIA